MVIKKSIVKCSGCSVMGQPFFLLRGGRRITNYELQITNYKLRNRRNHQTIQGCVGANLRVRPTTANHRWYGLDIPFTVYS
jgi:hypothetical protein